MKIFRCRDASPMHCPFEMRGDTTEKVIEQIIAHCKAEHGLTEMGMTQVCSWPLVVALPSGAGSNPIGKAFKRFRNGASDSLAYFWQVTVKSGIV